MPETVGSERNSILSISGGKQAIPEAAVFGTSAARDVSGRGDRLLSNTDTYDALMQDGRRGNYSHFRDNHDQRTSTLV